MDKITHHRWEDVPFESLPQWIKRKTGRFLRGRAFFYIRQQVPIHAKYEYKTIYHRKLRYHSKKQCKHFENWNLGGGADCNYDTRFFNTSTMKS